MKKPVTRFVIVERHIEALMATFVRPDNPRTAPVTWAELVALKEATKAARRFRGDQTMVLDERDFAEQLERIRTELAFHEGERRRRADEWEALLGDDARSCA